jgi:hypothetical protein
MPHSLDALDWLARDHAEIRRLFADFDRLARRHGAEIDRARLAERLCSHLCLHMQIEEEIVHPALRTALGDDAVLAHVLLDHAGAQELLARLDAMQFGDPDFNATVAVLEAYFVPHMTEVDRRLTPRVRAARLDTAMLGQRIAERLKTLMGDRPPVGPTAGHSRRPGQAAGCGPGPAVSRRAMGVMSTPGVG